MRQTIFKEARQLSLFAADMRQLTDEQIIASITDHPCAWSDNWLGDYRMEQVYQRLTPSKRKVAEAVVELYKRSREKRKNAVQIRSSKDAYELLNPLMGDCKVEEFWLVAMNHAAKVIGYKRISVGGIDGTYADIRIILRELIIIGATQFVVAHNHPSGNLMPSAQDRSLTRQISEGGKAVHVKLLDHLIISSDGFYSFNDEGLI